MNVLCKIGLHWPIKKLGHSFTDRVSTRSVWEGGCPCGKRWLCDSKHAFPAFKVEIND